MLRSSFLRELRRRKVFRVAVVYAVVGFVVVQVADLLVPALLLPEWTLRLVAFLLILGFPIALVLAWAFELTPEGVVRSRPPDSGDRAPAAEAVDRPRRVLLRRSLLGGVAVLVLVAAVIAVLRPATGPDPAPETSREGAHPFVAVLPFANRSPDPANEYFSEGVSEDILLQLARLDELRVIGPASAARFRNSEASVQEIARELGVDAVLVGSVRRDEDMVRITAQLLDGRTGEPQWAESYDRELADIFRVQTEVAGRVATSLLATLSPAGAARLARRPTDDIEAYNLYLMGRHLADRRSVAALERSLDAFREAIDTDPGYALAYVGMADAYTQLGTWGGIDADSAFAAARRAARRALDLDSTASEAWASLGYVRMWYDRDWDLAEAAFRRATELNPNYATGHHWYSLLLVAHGRFDEAEVAIMTAAELEPLSRIIRTILGRLYWLTGRTDEAVAEHRTALDLDPGYAVGHMWLALAHLDQGRTDDAVRQLRRGWELDPEAPVLRAGLALSHVLLGETESALEILEDLRDRGGGRSPVPFWNAVVLSRLGEADRAFDELEEAVRARDGWLTELKVNPLLDPLREDPRYDELLRRLRLR